jgi:hypothetical protein
MPKVFDCEDSPNKFMEMPCMCDCGKWFDLYDGYTSRKSNQVICKDCRDAEICKKCGGEGWIYQKNGRVRKFKCNED